MKRLLAFQLMLSQRKGLPLSRLLTNRETDTRFSEKAEQKRLQQESAFPKLTTKSNEVKVEEMECTVKEEKEEEGSPRKEVLSSGPTHYTLRSFPTGANLPSTQPLTSSKPQPEKSPFSVPPPPIFTPPSMPFFQAPQYCQTPAAIWGLCGGCHCWGTILPIWVAQ